MAALGAARKMASPVPSMNHLGAEVSITLEIEDMIDPTSAHLPGKVNDIADFFSRVWAPQKPPKPAGIDRVKLRTVERSDRGRGYALPTAAQRPELWAGGLEEEEA